MPDPLHISRVNFRPARETVARTGHLGSISFDLGPLRISNARLRRSESGRVYVSYRHARIRPPTDDARVRVEVALLAALGIKAEGGAP